MAVDQSSRINQLRQQLGGPRDGALLRYSLGAALFDHGELEEASEMLSHAVLADPGYSAAWKLGGKVRLALNDPAGAAQQWQQGIAAARQRGDKQAEKEMTVFLRRLGSPAA
ncbi:hypothetical protein ACYJW8_06765 [Frateuria aurantia]